MGYQISIIIPLYNISWEIFKECLDSIFSQLDKNIEVIIINDGSNLRKAVDCCQEYIKNYDTVHLIDRAENKGVSATRNEGIENSCGTFLMFVDADDMLEIGALDKIKHAIDSSKKIDTVFFEYSILRGNIKKECFRQINPQDCKYFTPAMVERMILGTDFNSPCTIVYSRQLIQEKHIRFDSKVALGEDFKFNSQYLQFFTNGMYIRESLYLYRMRDGSATNSFSMKKVEDTGVGYFIGKNLIETYFSGKELEDISGEFCNLYYKNLLSHILNGIIEGTKNEQIQKCYKIKWVKDLMEIENVKIKFPLELIIKSKDYKVFWMLAQLKKILKNK